MLGLEVSWLMLHTDHYEWSVLLQMETAVLQHDTATGQQQAANPAWGLKFRLYLFIFFGMVA